MKGHKCPIAVDSIGNLHQVLVHKVHIQGSQGGAVLADIVLKQQKKVKKVLADLGYRGFFEEVIRSIHKRSLTCSPKITGEFIIQPKRWIVERTIAWLNGARQLSKDFEQKCIDFENIIRISAMVFILKKIH